jgi:hypothetical protein
VFNQLGFSKMNILFGRHNLSDERYLTVGLVFYHYSNLFDLLLLCSQGMMR